VTLFRSITLLPQVSALLELKLRPWPAHPFLVEHVLRGVPQFVCVNDQEFKLGLAVFPPLLLLRYHPPLMFAAVCQMFRPLVGGLFFFFFCFALFHVTSASPTQFEICPVYFLVRPPFFFMSFFDLFVCVH